MEVLSALVSFGATLNPPSFLPEGPERGPYVDPKNSPLYWAVTYGGVVLFTLLTAYDVWWVKKVGAEVEEGASKQKLAVMGAISLYLDFVNLMLFFLRIFGGRN